MRIPQGSINVSDTVQVMDDAGLPKTGLTAATFPAVKWNTPDTADVAIPLVDLASVDAEHVDGGVFERGEGRYRICYPDAMFSGPPGNRHVRGEAAGKRLIAEPIQVTDGEELSDTALNSIRAAVMPPVALAFPMYPAKGGPIRIVKEDDYTGDFVVPWILDNASGLPDMSDWTAVFRVISGNTPYEVPATIAVATGSTRSGTITIPNAVASLRDQTTMYQIIFFEPAVPTALEHTLIEGTCTIKRKIPSP